jgi:hypothetical protein
MAEASCSQEASAGTALKCSGEVTRTKHETRYWPQSTFEAKLSQSVTCKMKMP